MSQEPKSARTAKLEHPLVAIIRGVKPQEAEDVARALYEAGFRAIEIPLNSPDPFTSIERVAKLGLPDCLVGAGTVLSASEVDRLHNAGGELMVSPNIDAEVLSRAVSIGMVTMPGVFTPTEALLAVRLGASALKFFPAFKLGPDGIDAIRVILPEHTVVAAVGGVSEKNFAQYIAAGITTFSLGSSVYRPGDSASEVAKKATRIVDAYDQARAAHTT